VGAERAESQANADEAEVRELCRAMDEMTAVAKTKAQFDLAVDDIVPP
jgi:hypothetical protein